MGIEPYPTFDYVKAKWITANHPGAGYQYKMTIAYESGMKDNFDDIRVSDGTNILKYYIESYVSSTSAVVYIRLSASNYIYIHYGNSSATSESSGADVFDFFDDFSAGSIDTSKWTVTNDVSLSGGECVLTSGATRGIVEGKTGFIQPVRVESKARFGIQLFDGSVVCGLRQAGDDNNRLYVSGKNTDTGGIYFATIAGGAITNTPYAQATNTTDHIYSILWESGSAKLYVDGTLRVTNTTNVSAGTQYPCLKEGSTAGQYSYVDWIRVRKYVATEPTVEDYSLPLIVAGFSYTQTLTIYFTDTSTNSPTSWDWDFGDGSEHGTTQNPSHEYAASGTYTVVLTATNASSSDTYTFDVTVLGPGGTNTVTIVRIWEMDHKVDTTQKHTFQIQKSDGTGFSNTCTSPVISCSVNGATESTETWTISAFNNTMSRFTLEVVDPGTWEIGDNIDINISCTEGEGNISLNIVSGSSVDVTASLTSYGVATSAELTAIKGSGWTDETLVTIQTAAEAGGSSSGSTIVNSRIAEPILKNGTTQTVRFTALATDYTDFTGENTGDSLPDVILVYSEKRSTGWVDQPIENPVCLWQAENVAFWEAEIPSEYITLSSGIATLQVSGTGIIMVTIPLTIGNTITPQEIWEYTDRTITSMPTADGSDLVTLSTIVTLPSGRTKTFEQIIEDIYKYRKW